VSDVLGSLVRKIVIQIFIHMVEIFIHIVETGERDLLLVVVI
jgi:hypothetical protein